MQRTHILQTVIAYKDMT